MDPNLAHPKTLAGSLDDLFSDPVAGFPTPLYCKGKIYQINIGFILYTNFIHLCTSKYNKGLEKSTS